MKSSLFAITTAPLTLGLMGIAQAGTIVVPNSVSTTLSTNPSSGVAISYIKRFFRTYTVENSSRSLSA